MNISIQSATVKLVSANILKQQQLLLEWRSLSRKQLGIWRRLRNIGEISLLSHYATAITIIHESISLWKHGLPNIWTALIAEGRSSISRICNRSSCTGRSEMTAGMTSVLTFHSFTRKCFGIRIESRAIKVFELRTINGTFDSIGRLFRTGFWRILWRYIKRKFYCTLWILFWLLILELLNLLDRQFATFFHILMTYMI